MGITLLLTNSNDETADYLQGCLLESRHAVVRWDTDTFVASTSFTFTDLDYSLQYHDTRFKPTDVSTVIYRRPKPLKVEQLEDEALTRHAGNEWAEAIEGFLANIDPCKWINHPTFNVLASHKLDQLQRASHFDLIVPRSLATNDSAQARDFISSQTDGVIVKPLHSGLIERSEPYTDTVIYTSEFRPEHYELLNDLGRCPVLFQERVTKDYDIRLTVVDTQMQAVALRKRTVLNHQVLDIRRDAMRGVNYELIEIPTPVKESVIELMHHYKLRFAALDFGMKKNGEWVFFEINPNGQWAWLDLVGGCSIAQMFESSVKRAAI